MTQNVLGGGVQTMDKIFQKLEEIIRIFKNFKIKLEQILNKFTEIIINYENLSKF